MDAELAGLSSGAPRVMERSARTGFGGSLGPRRLEELLTNFGLAVVAQLTCLCCFGAIAWRVCVNWREDGASSVCAWTAFANLNSTGRRRRT